MLRDIGVIAAGVFVARAAWAALEWGAGLAMGRLVEDVPEPVVEVEPEELEQPRGVARPSGWH